MSERVLCLFHANCTDGAASAAVIRRKYPQAKCYPMNHGDPIRAKVKGKKLFIVDFSFKPEILARFQSEAAEVHWYDHHITAVPTYEQLGWGDVDLNECGASLTWKKEFPDQPLPKILEYVRDKDLFLWNLPQSRELSMYLRGVEDLTNPSNPIWNQFLDGISEEKWREMIHEGETGLKFQDRMIQQGMRSAFEVDFHGYRAMAVNWSLEASDIGERIYKKKKFEVAIMFYYTRNLWNFSLRSDRVDVSKLALKYGGGGHPGAAGFRTEKLDFLLKMKKEAD